MKWITVFAFMSLSVILCSCHDDCEKTIIEDCVAATLDRLDFERYHGQEMGCRTYLTLYLLNDEKFFMLGSACADYMFNVMDCEGNQFCDSLNSECITYFTENAVSKGVIGLSKE